MAQKESTFWDHLEVLRSAIIRSIIAIAAVAAVMFALKDFMFGTIIFGPTQEDFPTFRFLRWITETIGLDGSQMEIEPIKIISTQISAQLFTHLSVSLWAGVVICVPYITGEIWYFVKPALYQNEKNNILRGLFFSGILFYLGVATSYYLILPLSVNFLGNYHVLDSIENLIDLDSYIDTLVTLCLSTGISFELPIVAYFLAKAGILKHHFISSHRKHAFLLVLIMAAMITPSTDIFTMLVTALPLQLIYELSVWVVRKAEHHQANKEGISIAE